MAEGEWQGDFDPLADPEESRVILATLDSFHSYRRAAHYNVTHIRRQSFYSLPSSQWTLLASPPFSILDTLSSVDDAIDSNADIADAIFNTSISSFLPESLTNADNEDVDPVWKGKATPADMDKARSTLRQLYRDWSAEGAPERDVCFSPVLSALSTEFRDISLADRGNVQVLVPGAGLGRLVFEVCLAGFAVQGNEISYHQLMTSSLMLNHTTKVGQYALYPWALSFSNHLRRENQLQRVMIPDVHPGTVLREASQHTSVHAFERLSMTAADFCVLYSGEDQKDTFNAVATVFFIDTAPNLIRYIQAIANCLTQGGIWINLGPLLWHFENNPPGSSGDDSPSDPKGSRRRLDRDAGIGEAGSVELTEEEVIALVEHFGFKIEKHEHNQIETGYIQDPQSMLQNVYKPSFWIARKL